MKMKMFPTLDKAKPDIDNTYKKLKLAAGLVYDCSSDYTVFVV
jgi:hypothetical protein